MRRIWPLLLLLPLLAAQQTATVEGVVTNSATGAPVRKALVTLRFEDEHAGYQLLTDAGGRFRFENVQPAKYAICAEAQGFSAMVPDASRAAPPSLLVTVAAAQAVKDLAIQLAPRAAISGKIVDENGEPIAGAGVAAVRYAYSREGKRLYRGATVLRKTNDRGEYRLFDIPAGRWYVEVDKTIEAPKASGRVHGAIAERRYETALIPVDLAAGADVANFDIRLAIVHSFRLRGKVIDGRTGQPAPGGRVHVDGDWYSTVRTDGTFELAMKPGVHSLFADTAGQDKLFSTTEQVAIGDQDVGGVTFRLLPPVTVRGVLLLDSAPAPTLANTQISLQPVSGVFSDAGGRAGADGSFEMSGLAPTSYRVSFGSRAKGQYLSSIRFGDRDVSEDARIDVVAGSGPLTLSFSTNPAQVSGTIRARASGPVPIRVTIAPEDRYNGRADLIKTVDPDDDTGVFHIRDLPPGEYKVFAWELADEKLAEYPEFRRLLESKAVPVTVRAGELKTVEPAVITAAEVADARRKLP